MSVFRFKKFEVRNDLAAQKVGTDAVLLGAAMTLPPAGPSRRYLLDIGTGTGVIALMAAQRLATNFRILGIDIDPAAISEAAANFAASPWAESLQAIQSDLSQVEAALGFDAIFSNPPYFEDSLKAPDARRSTARHTDTLSYREICAFASQHLAPQGTLSLILPASEETPLLRYAASFGLRAFRILRIRTTVRKTPKRIIAEFRRCDAPAPDVARPGAGLVEEELILMDGQDRSAAYSALTADFYL